MSNCERRKKTPVYVEHFISYNLLHNVKKEKVSLEHTLQQVVIITHLMSNYHLLKTCRTFGLIQIMSPISSHHAASQRETARYL